MFQSKVLHSIIKEYQRYMFLMKQSKIYRLIFVQDSANKIVDFYSSRQNHMAPTSDCGSEKTNLGCKTQSDEVQTSSRKP
jgi:hypothetical protein